MLFTILDVFAAVSNLGVMVLILHKPSLRTVSNLLVCTLALTDFLVAVLVVPFSILGYKSQSWSHNDSFCIFHGFLFNTLYIISGTFTSVVSIDRFYSLASPMSHTANVSGHHFLWITAFVIVHSIFWASFPLYNIDDFEYAYMPRQSRCSFSWSVSGALGVYLFFLILVTFLVPVFASTLMYYKSVQAAMESARKIRPGNVHIERFSNGDFTSVAKVENVGSSKAVLTVSVIVGSFIICRAPFLICSIGTWLNGTDFCPAKVELSFSWLQYLGVLTNPYVYTILNRRLRGELKVILKSLIFVHDHEEDDEPKDVLDYLRNLTNNENGTSSTFPQRQSSGCTSRFSTEIETLNFPTENNGNGGKRPHENGGKLPTIASNDTKIQENTVE